MERQYADALNMMTLNFRQLTMNKFREDDILGKVKADAITSSIKIRSIEPQQGMRWTFPVFAAKESTVSTHSARVHGKDGVPLPDAIDLRGPVGAQHHGLYLGEFWEQQMVGEKDIDLDQKSGLLDRGDEVPK